MIRLSTLLLAAAPLLVGAPACATGAPPAGEAPAGEAPAAAPAGAVTTVDVGALKARMDAGPPPVIIDVRTPEEFAEGRVPGAVNIPVDELEARISEVPDGAWLICRSGGRSARAAGVLARAGRGVTDVGGGTLAWTAAGFPVER
jgi:rhodanese-related sulfurtransferase